MRSSSTSGDMVILELANATHLMSLVNGLACVSKINLLISANDKMLCDDGGCPVRSVIGDTAIKFLNYSSVEKVVACPSLTTSESLLVPV